MKKKPSFIQKANYRFDNFMSRGLSVLILGLFGLSLLLILIVVGIVSIAKAAPNGEHFGRLLWMALMRALDAGTMSDDHGNFLFISAMFFVTLVGIFLVSTLIGILSNCIDQKMEELRRGRSQVLEEGHILILGWSDEIYTIIRELIIANENQKRACVVVLSENDKAEMELEIHSRIKNRRTTRIICRSGNPLDVHSQEIVRPQTAKTIILLPPTKNDPDAWVIKGVLSVTNNPNRKDGQYHIVAPIKEKKNLDALKVISERDNIQPIYFEDLIARITAQTSRQCGLSIIYTELLNFENDEIYFVNEPRLHNKTCLDALLAYEDSAILGIKQGNGDVILNPSADMVIVEGDSLIGISRDDDTFLYSEKI